MKKEIIYDFTKAQEHANGWLSPQELSIGLRKAALGLAYLVGRETDAIQNIMLMVDDACMFLDTITVKEVKQSS